MIYIDIGLVLIWLGLSLLILSLLAWALWMLFD
jgi:hypothetical protein